MRPHSPQVVLVRSDSTTPRIMQTWSPSYLQALTSTLEIEPASSSVVRTSSSTPEIEPASSSNVRTSTSTEEIESTLSSNVETSSTSTQESIVSIPTHKPKLTMEMLTRVTIVEKGVCVICLEEWCKGTMAMELPCKHKFHFECVNKWLGIRATCPLCRYGYDSEDDDYSGSTSSDSEAE